MSAALVETSDRVMTITLNRPEAFNAVNMEMSNLVAEALERAEHDDDVRVVIIRGAGTKAFCSGADLKAVSRGEELFDAEGRYGDWGLAGCTERTIAKPVIAAVEGIAYGGGFEVALAADIVVASSAAKFALPEVKVGLVAGAGGAVRLPRQLPLKVAMDLLLTGEPLGAERAYSFGLVSRLTAPGETYAEALRLATQISKNAPLSLQASKKVAVQLEAGRAGTEEAGWKTNSVEFHRILASNDAKEGAAAFAEKRAPQWTGT
ncbi:crotonase/enoyl-CoA hydratase family protein [Arthrobacter sp. NPDC055138]